MARSTEQLKCRVLDFEIFGSISGKVIEPNNNHSSLLAKFRFHLLGLFKKNTRHLKKTSKYILSQFLRVQAYTFIKPFTPRILSLTFPCHHNLVHKFFIISLDYAEINPTPKLLKFVCFIKLKIIFR